MIPKPFPVARHALVVVAHPDDESFGLGAVLDVLVRGGAEVSVLCFTHGEAPTLHGGETGDLFQVRQAELAAAANALGVGHARLLSYPDGSLSSVALSELVARVRAVTAELRPSCLVALDEGGVTGHRDHAHATTAAVTLLDLPVFGWTIPDGVARALNARSSAPRSPDGPSRRSTGPYRWTGAGSGGRSRPMSASRRTTPYCANACGSSATPNTC